jgi:hypothetical protein
MTDPDDAATREVLRRAHESDPDRVDFNAGTGLADLLRRGAVRH